MKISTRGRYGLRLLVDIAEQDIDAPVALATVAKRQHLSEKYLQQVALLLTRGGVLVSVKGSGGGYSLAKRPEDILMYDVLDLLEGNIAFEEDPPASETAVQRVIRHHFYRPIDRNVRTAFGTLNLADVLQADCFSDET
ncbi:MAG TPA: Rrf2 family transcriptional regulator [Sphaerochaeta sp.]|nr:Rrf2 family transcriptional regulator [Spirochaetota bacterium]NLK13770.1 Rrf2 family transcriptional regulator [Spirochaetales bacterium]HPX29351.1 Rrf2 family transcriptional regulator [Sphaerochaeta sp.]HQB55060.1 Rrf2 family transcriptional regulator [Sphaerochaeta sp.]